MIQKLIERLRWSATRVIMLVAVLGCSACGSVFDDEGDCTPYYFVQFVYDMNMLRTDAFATQVTSVDLYVFDAKTGAYVTHITDKGEALASGTYKMPLNIPPGDYELVAWCGLADNNGDFTVSETITNIEDLRCTMTRSRDGKGAYSVRNLHSLFHGMKSVELPNKEGKHIVTVKLTKDTNNINLSLQHTAGPLDPTRFEVTMTDENGLMAYDNSLLANEPIEYRPWSFRSGTLDVAGGFATKTDDEGGKEAGFLITEISTARLMVDHEARINILDKEKGTVIFSIPMVQWALMFRSANHASMGEQEYLDREDEYNLMVFLADDKNNPDGWMAMSVVINGWHVINNGDVEF